MRGAAGGELIGGKGDLTFSVITPIIRAVEAERAFPVPPTGGVHSNPGTIPP